MRKKNVVENDISFQLEIDAFIDLISFYFLFIVQLDAFFMRPSQRGQWTVDILFSFFFLSSLFLYFSASILFFSTSFLFLFFSFICPNSPFHIFQLFTYPCKPLNPPPLFSFSFLLLFLALPLSLALSEFLRLFSKGRNSMPWHSVSDLVVQSIKS